MPFFWVNLIRPFWCTTIATCIDNFEWHKYVAAVGSKLYNDGIFLNNDENSGKKQEN